MTMTTITIRPYQPEDAQALFEAARESVADVYPWLPWCHPEYTLGEAQSWIASQLENVAQGCAYEFVIVGNGGRYLGGCGVNQVNRAHLGANLGYWIRSSAAGRGYAPRAVRALATWAFAHTDLERLEILVATANGRSQRVAEKAGANYEGVLRCRLHAHGRFDDAMVYSIVRSDWKPPA